MREQIKTKYNFTALNIEKVSSNQRNSELKLLSTERRTLENTINDESFISANIDYSNLNQSTERINLDSKREYSG